MIPDILGVKFGSSGSNSRVRSACSNVFPSDIRSYTVSVWSPFVTIVEFPSTLTGAYIIRLGSLSFEGSNASVLMPSSCVTNTRFLLFTLLPMMKYAVTAYLPSSDFPITMPLPGYALLLSSDDSDFFCIVIYSLPSQQ